MRLTRLLALALALAALTLLPGCGEEDAQKALDDARARVEGLRDRVDEYRERADELRRDAGRIGERVRDQVRKALDDLRKAVPTASLPAPSSGARQGDAAIERFLTETLRSIDGYWTRTLATAGQPEPRVSYLWVPPGGAARSACGEAADDRAAFYCPADDTIYIGQRFASELWRGVSRGFPGEAAGGRAVGDFGLAYVVAHEYGHNIQQELGFFSAARGPSARPFELQADCFAGAWGNAVYQEGKVTEEDVREALSTALAAGDFEVGSEQHHGTPEERRDAWLLGWSTGDPAECGRFVGV
jgi:predicted metalloprotease